MFSGETLQCKPFWKKRQEEKEWQNTLNKIRQRNKGTRRRWDITMGEVIQNGHKPPTTSSEAQEQLKRIIRKNGQ